MLGQPCFYLGMLVGCVIVGDQMNIQIFWCFPFDFLEERQPFLMPVLFGDGCDQFSLQIV
jgi:hypothetical protein